MSADQGHVAVPEDGGPWDTCELCKMPIRDRYGKWVTMIGANAECYGRRP